MSRPSFSPDELRAKVAELIEEGNHEELELLRANEQRRRDAIHENDQSDIFCGKRKMCTGCEEILSFDQFHKNKNLPDGKANRCKECTRQYRLNNLAKLRAIRQKKRKG